MARFGLISTAHQDEIDRALADSHRAQAHLAAELDDLRSTLSDLRGWVAALVGEQEELRGRLDWVQAERERDLGEQEDIRTQLSRLDIDRVGDELQRLNGLIAHTDPLAPDRLSVETFIASTGETVLGFRDGGSERADLYPGFEDVFRGSEDWISDRQQPYIPLLTGHGPVLDVGCGRGELLSLLSDAGIDARGVDMDVEMVRRCRDRGLDVSEDDAIHAVRAAEGGSLGAVVALQVVEHLPYAQLTSFFSSARSALTPGGLLVIETVNPHNPQALKHFWIDPTHQHPLFPEVVLVLLRLSGFAEGYIWYPHGSNDSDRDRLNQPDYTIVGTAPPVRP